MHVEPGERSLVGRGLGMRRGELVVREGQVASAALNVEAETQPVAGDRGTLDMPAGPSVAPRRRPRGLTGSLHTPQQGIEGMLLARSVRIATTFRECGSHLVVVVSRFVTEVRRCTMAVIHVGVPVDRRVDPVGMTAVDQFGDHLHDLVDGLGGGHVLLRRHDPQRLHVGAEAVRLRIPEFTPVHPVALGTLEQRIVDIGRVLDVVHRVPRIEQLAIHQVEGQVGRGVAEMGGVIRSDPAYVHPGEGPRVQVADGALGGVEQSQGKTVAGNRGDDRRGPRVHEGESRDFGDSEERPG